MLDLEWSPDAVDDLDSIWDFIAEDSPDAADSFIERLREQARELCRIPQKGNPIPEMKDDSFRELFYKGYTLVYEITPTGIIIHEAFNQRQVFIRSYPRNLRRN